MDLHAGQIQGFFDIPVDHLTAVPLLSDYFKGQGLTDVVVVSPDAGGIARVRDMAERLGAPVAFIDKRRPEPNVAEVMNIVGKVSGKNAILLDDIIDTGGSIVQAAKALRAKGAASVMACATPVSYTHLDVYKRQVVGRRGSLPRPARRPAPPWGIGGQPCAL